MQPKAFVYTEVAISVPFDKAPWRDINESIRKQPGFLNKTWLQGHSTQSIGGFYTFNGIDTARRFVTGYFPSEARTFGVAHTTRVFDAEIAREASVDLEAPHFGIAPGKQPGAFVYTELQLSKPFAEFDWKSRNAALKKADGLQSGRRLAQVGSGEVKVAGPAQPRDEERTHREDKHPNQHDQNCAPLHARLPSEPARSLLRPGPALAAAAA